MTEPEDNADKLGETPDGDRKENREERRAENRDDSAGSGHQTSAQDNGNTEAPAPATPGGRGSGDNLARPGRSGPLVWLAMLVALASLGLASYPFWSHWLNPETAERSGPSASRFERLAERVDTIRQDSEAEIESLRDDLGRLSSAFEADAQGPEASVLAERIDQLSARVERLQGERNTAIGGLRSRLEQLESEVGRRLEQFELKLSNVGGDLDRADDDLATRLVLMEADSLFAIAQNHLALGGEGGVGLQAWERALERLAVLEGPEFQGLKETARREFTQLQEYRPADLGVHVERLFDMAESVAEWPVKTVGPGERPGEPEADQGWRARLGQVVGSLVRVESVDRDFLAPDEVDLARERVRSTLQTAALALVRSRPDIARGLVDEAVAAVQRVFDTDAASVSLALGRLEDIAAGADRVEPPELGDSRAEISRLLGGMR